MRHGHESAGRRPAAGEEKPSAEGISGWLAGRLPEDWFETAPTVTIDRDEILIVGRLSPPELPEGEDEVSRAAEKRRHESKGKEKR